MRILFALALLGLLAILLVFSSGCVQTAEDIKNSENLRKSLKEGERSRYLVDPS